MTSHLQLCTHFPLFQCYRPFQQLEGYRAVGPFTVQAEMQPVKLHKAALSHSQVKGNSKKLEQVLQLENLLCRKLKLLIIS